MASIPRPSPKISFFERQTSGRLIVCFALVFNSHQAILGSTVSKMLSQIPCSKVRSQSRKASMAFASSGRLSIVARHRIQ